MTHYEKRLERDLDSIRADLHRVGEDVERALDNAVHALLSHDRQLASATILGDLPINRAVRALDRRCHAFVARHLPTAGHLRFVSSVLRLNIALERIGDYAVNISRETVQLTAEPPAEVAEDIELMAGHSRQLLTKSLEAFHTANAELARGTKGMASTAQSTFPVAFRDLLHAGEGATRPLKDLFALLAVFNALDRVGDQAKNICEETIFAATGETKEPKVYEVLFLDERNDRASQLAEAFARKAFPASGRYASAGWRPGEALDPECVAFMDRHGLEPSEARPKLLDATHANLSRYHVIAALEEGARTQIPELPFQTVLLDWLLPTASVEDTYRDISHRVQELMDTLRGERAE